MIALDDIAESASQAMRRQHWIRRVGACACAQRRGPGRGRGRGRGQKRRCRTVVVDRHHVEAGPLGHLTRQQRVHAVLGRAQP